MLGWHGKKTRSKDIQGLDQEVTEIMDYGFWTERSEDRENRHINKSKHRGN